ncbi:MAG: hypothetical protein ABIK97_05255 [candidate division WOR-3 bacterium]
MIRNAYQRINKYIAKLEPEINKVRYEKLKEQMIENASQKYQELAALDNKIKTILDSHPETIPTQYLFHFSYVKEIWRLTNKYSGSMLYKLAAPTESKWEVKGLNKEIMEKLRIDLFGIIL